MRILYTTTIGLTMGFFKELIRELTLDGHVVDIACNETEYKVPGCYSEWGCHIYPVSWDRSPKSKGNIKAIKEVKKIVSENHYDIVHCHTPIAAACTRIACRKMRSTQDLKVIYTAHGFHFYKGAPLSNWILYYPIEKLCSYWTDILVTINQEDYAFAKRRMKAKKIVYVPGVGVDIQKFSSAVVDKETKRAEIGVPADSVLLFSVGELNKNKNHEIVIRAIAELNRSDIHYIIAGKGDLYDFLEDLAHKLNIPDKIHLLGYRTDIAELNKISDIFVFPSVREGLPVAAIEGMASGLAFIASDNRGIRDLATNNVNAIICEHSSQNQFAKAIERLTLDENLRTSMGKRNAEIAKKFDTSRVLEQMSAVYFARKNNVSEEEI